MQWFIAGRRTAVCEIMAAIFVKHTINIVGMAVTRIAMLSALDHLVPEVRSMPVEQVERRPKHRKTSVNGCKSGGRQAMTESYHGEKLRQRHQQMGMQTRAHSRQTLSPEQALS
jgi:hypothetical protein